MFGRSLISLTSTVFCFLARLRRLLLGLEFVLAEIHDLADGDFPIHCNLDEIETSFLSPGKRVALIRGAVVLARLIDKLNITSNNGIVYARPSLFGGSSYWTAYLTFLWLFTKQLSGPARAGLLPL